MCFMRRASRVRRIVAWLCVSAIMLLSTVVGQASKAKLAVWDWWDIANPSIKAYYDWVTTTFEAANPDIELEYQFIPESQYYTRIITAVAAGVRPMWCSYPSPGPGISLTKGC